MRYSKWALLIFGAGCVLGLVVVAARLPGLARVASLTMAGGLVLLPLAVVVDWRQRLPRRSPVAKKPRKSRTAKRSAPARKPTRRKR